MCAIWPNPARPSRGKPGGPVEISCGKNVAGILIFFPAIFSNIFRTFMHFSQHVCNSSGEQTQLLVVLAVPAVVFVVVIIVYGPGAGSVAVSAAAAAGQLCSCSNARDTQFSSSCQSQRRTPHGNVGELFLYSVNCGINVRYIWTGHSFWNVTDYNLVLE